MIGQTISHYRVLEKIGEGGMGLVYLAEDSTLRRKVALKFLPDYLQEDETAHKRFIREARSAAALDHPFICHIHEVGEVEGRDFIAMEYVEGETLRETLKSGPLTLKEALHIANELIDALEKAHSQGIVHRDLKPANIMITPDGHIKVMDFGLAKQVSVAGAPEQDITAQATQALTQAGTALGTLTYMSPEQACGEPVDTRSDIFSFGIVLYEMLTGKNPFREGSPIRTLSAILNKPAPLVSQGKRRVSAELEDLVAKMLEKELEKRCQSVAEVRDQLKKVGSHSLWKVLRDLIEENRVLKWSLAGILVFLLAGLTSQLGLFEFSWFTERGDVKRDVSELSLAVIPIEDNTGDPGRGHWATGMTIELISELGELGKWRRLPPYQSMKRYVGSQQPVAEIGKELDVDLILSSSLSSGDGVRLHVFLHDAPEEELIWSDKYVRTELDIEEIQLQVVRDIAKKLRIDLTADQKERLERGTTNVEAYQAYLGGRSQLGKRRPSSLKKAFTRFEEAIDLAPDYAKAYSGLAYGHAVYAGWGFEPPIDFWPKAVKNAERAIGIDDQNAEAHTVLGMTALFYDYNWSEAETELSLAKANDPNDPASYHNMAKLQVAKGQFEAAHETGQYVLNLHPKSTTYRRAVGFHYFLAGRYEEAVKALTQLLEADPNYPVTNFWLFLCYHKMEMYPQAFEALLEEQKITQRRTKEVKEKILEELPSVYDESGYKEAVNYLADLLVEQRETGYVHATDILYLYAAAGNREAALEWLGRSFQESDASVAFLKVHPMWDFFRDDPIYQDLLAQLNFPENQLAP